MSKSLFNQSVPGWELQWSRLHCFTVSLVLSTGQHWWTRTKMFTLPRAAPTLFTIILQHFYQSSVNESFPLQSHIDSSPCLLCLEKCLSVTRIILLFWAASAGLRVSGRWWLVVGEWEMSRLYNMSRVHWWYWPWHSRTLHCTGAFTLIITDSLLQIMITHETHQQIITSHHQQYCHHLQTIINDTMSYNGSLPVKISTAFKLL